MKPSIFQECLIRLVDSGTDEVKKSIHKIGIFASDYAKYMS